MSKSPNPIPKSSPLLVAASHSVGVAAIAIISPITPGDPISHSLAFPLLPPPKLACRGSPTGGSGGGLAASGVPPRSLLGEA